MVNNVEYLESKPKQKEEIKKEEKVETSDPYQNFANEFDTANLELPF